MTYAYLQLKVYDGKTSLFSPMATNGLMRYFYCQKATPETRSFQPQLAGLSDDRGRREILTGKRVVGHLLDYYASQVIKAGRLTGRLPKLKSVSA